MSNDYGQDEPFSRIVPGCGCFLMMLAACAVLFVFMLFPPLILVVPIVAFAAFPFMVLLWLVSALISALLDAVLKRKNVN